MMTIPRLELCGAVLLSRLASKVKTALDIQSNNIFYWSDSQIVLSWLHIDSSRLKTFVSNRVSGIQTLTQIQSWQHVPSRENPADFLSRGLTLIELLNCSTWWSEPSWLSQPSVDWPKSSNGHSIDFLELRREKTLVATAQVEPPNSFGKIIEQISSYSRLKRVISYCLRFLHNCRRHAISSLSGSLTTSELHSSEIALLKIMQRESFPQELLELQAKGELNRSSKILSLNPFLDKDGLIRVGGRLRHSKFHFDKKHPVVIPTYHHLSIIIARHQDQRLLHAGPQATLYALRQLVWPINGRNLGKKVIRECAKCLRFQCQPPKHIMGDLPSGRITPTRPFLISGVDYGGPHLIKDRSTRNYKRVKAYICLFVCFATKAVHLELVSDLTADAFLASLQRFKSRREKCHTMYSDNATNFQGVEAELSKFVKSASDSVESKLSQKGVTWKFIPPPSSHFGGLWEAGIRSVKHHIKRVIGGTILSFEQFYTVLTQIEACLKSRSLQLLSSDPEDFAALTPAHFLIGEPLTTIPEPNWSELTQNRLDRYQRVRQIHQHFWTRWSKEYISELQLRLKWKRDHHLLIQLGSLVLLKEDNCPPLRWPMGRVVSLNPGADGVVRVVTVKTVRGCYKRSISKLCMFPTCEV